MNDIKVSIVVPVYNVEKYLYKCLESIQNQTLHEIEVICVNDGSTDSSLSIIHTFIKTDSRFHVIDKVNTGYGNSVNMGIDKANGTYVGIVESDDFVEPCMFEKLYLEAEEQKADLVKGNYNFYRELAKEHSKFHEILKGFPYHKVFCALDNRNVFHIPASVWSAVYNREFLNSNAIRFTETKGASYQDLSFTFKVFTKAKRISFIEDAVINYRIDNADSSVNNPQKIYCVCDEFKEIEDFLIRQDNPDESKLIHIMELVKFHSYLWNYNRLAVPYQYSFLIKMAEEFKDAWKENKLDKQLWEEKKWIELQEIIENADLYFKQTSKDYKDQRMELLPVLNNQFEYNEFMHCLQTYDHFYIYGAGVIGKQVFTFLESNGYAGKVKGFLVNSLASNMDTVSGIPVTEAAQTEAGNELILVSIKQTEQYEVARNLKEMGFSNILLISSKIRTYL